MSDPALSARTAVARGIARHREALVRLSHEIHAHPEVAFEEHRAARWCVEMLEAAGLSVRTGVHGLPTAFEATAGSGPLVVAICCEYDALPQIGHACGHNIIAAAGVGAGAGLAPVADRLGITVRVLGTPAEETGGGKALMLASGAFDGVDAAMMVHPAGVEAVAFRSFARSTLVVDIHGRASHAAAAPYDGRNAADAMTVAQVAIGLLRQQLPPTCRVHGVVAYAGDAPNVIPAHASARYLVRAHNAVELAGVRTRVEDCFRAGAQAAGCRLTIGTPEPDYVEFRGDAELAARFRANARVLGRPAPVAIGPAASTDMANVSHAVPSIHPVLDIGSGQTFPHQPDFAGYCVTPRADQAVVDGATAMAWTAIDLAERRKLPAPTEEVT